MHVVPHVDDLPYQSELLQLLNQRLSFHRLVMYQRQMQRAASTSHVHNYSVSAVLPPATT